MKRLQIRLVNLIKRAVSHIFKSQEPRTRFILLCQGRTGSTWLHTLLNAHLQIESDGESILRNSKRAKPAPIQELLVQKCSPFIRAKGLKIFYDHPLYEAALKELQAKKHYKIIVLQRRDYLAQFVSFQLAKASSSWSSSSTSHEQITIDINELEKHRKNTLIQLESALQLLSRHQKCHIYYEDLLTNTQEELARLQLFLDVPIKKLQSLLPRQSTGSLSDRIKNWNEVNEYMTTKKNMAV